MSEQKNIKYLVNRETKEHILKGHAPLWLDEDPDWKVIEADPEGWIKHDGGECPLPDYAPFVIRLESGREGNNRGGASDLGSMWSFTPGSEFNITHYRPVLDTEPEQFSATLESASDLIERLKTAHQSAAELPDIVAELRAQLEPLGYDLVARDPFVEPCCGMPSQCWEPCGDLGHDEAHVKVSEQPAEDMSDWRNWRVGDLVECVDDNGWSRLKKGEAYKVTDAWQSGVYLVGIAVAMTIYSKDFRFHSRPTGGES